MQRGVQLRNTLAALLLTAGSSACVTTGGEAPARSPSTTGDVATQWQVRQAQLREIDAFLMSGRVTSAELGLRADLRWRESNDGQYELRLSGPFGAGAVELRGNEAGVEVRNSDGSQYTSDPEGWIRARYGWTLPIAGLRHWALGLPIPEVAADSVLDDRGRLATLTQSGWQLQYTEYRQKNGYDLPRRFEADNGRVKLKLLIDQWDELPPAPEIR